jgi:hypothetical protein
MVLSLFAGIYGAWDLTLWVIKNRDRRSDAMTQAAMRRIAASTRKPLAWFGLRVVGKPELSR